MKPKTAKLAVLLAVIVAAIFFQLIYQPLPDDFEQPWKYRIICFGVKLSNIFGHFLEKVGIGHRVNLTRISYHLTVGAFNIRDHNDQISVHDETIEHLSIRIYRPMNKSLSLNGTYLNESLPTIIFYHGGGYFVGSADTLEPVSYLMAKYTQFLVIYIEYRLIPEHKYPAAYHDSLLATKYLLKNHDKYKIDLENLVLMGDSAGGNLATVISHHLIENKISKPKMQVLIYPIMQFYDFTLPSYRLNLPRQIMGNINHDNFKNFIHYFTGIEVDDSIFLNGHTTRHHKESMFSEYVNIGYLPTELRSHNLESVCQMNDTNGKYNELAEILLSTKVSPLLVDNEYLKLNTPDKTLLLTAEFDILRDDGFIYAERLRRIGKNLVHHHHGNLFHGIFGLLHGPLEFKRAHLMVKQVADHIKQVILK